MRVTMLFTLIGLFVALQFGEQHIFDDQGKNMTIIPTPLPMSMSHSPIAVMHGYFLEFY